jgi:hypothetical protein
VKWKIISILKISEIAATLRPRSVLKFREKYNVVSTAECIVLWYDVSDERLCERSKNRNVLFTIT